MSQSPAESAELAAIGTYLAQRRDAILAAWRHAVQDQPGAPASVSLDRRAFDDHIPPFLDTIESSLIARSAGLAAQPERRLPTASGAAGAAGPLDAPEAERQHDGAAHGLQRWQQGYKLTEVLTEWGRLHLCLIDELNRYERQRAQPCGPALDTARLIVAQACHTGVAESTAEFDRLRKTEADGRVRELQQALAQLHEIERDRAVAWREAAHDLRNNVSAVLRAGAVLSHPKLPATSRDERTAIFKGNIESLRLLLDDLLELSRIEAGREALNPTDFDAARLIQELGGLYEPVAQDKGLALTLQGPQTLPVQGDPIKVRRIMQNLLVNALKYTRAGSVWLRWGWSDPAGSGRWTVEVCDSGPGLDAAHAQSLAGASEQAGKPSGAVALLPAAAGSGTRAHLTLVRDQAAPASDPAFELPPSEGVGLTIVKRLCDLLGAAIEVQTVPGQGSCFRVSFAPAAASE